MARDPESRSLWPRVVIAAVLMFATLPGRTQGLGIFTEPLLADLGLSRVTYAQCNLWASLIGAAFCFPAGYLLDRLDARPVTTGIVLAFAVAVWGLSAVSGSVAAVFFWLLLTRGFGQSALSVASITAIGKHVGLRSAMPMAWYAVLLSLLFAGGFGLVGYGVREAGWRNTAALCAALLAFAVAPLPFLLRRHGTAKEEVNTPAGMTFASALRTPIFWIFAVGISAFGFVSSGLGLFNEAVLGERGFDRKTFHTFLAVSALAALAGQVLCGWASRFVPSKYLIGTGLLLYAAALGWLTILRNQAELWLISIVIGIAAGMMTVLFFSVWGQVFGGAHLGRIQAAAQMCTVITSAAGPVAFAQVHESTGSYRTLLWLLAGTVCLIAILSTLVPLPRAEPANVEL